MDDTLIEQLQAIYSAAADIQQKILFATASGKLSEGRARDIKSQAEYIIRKLGPVA